MILVRNIRLPLSAGEPQAFEKALHTLRVPCSKVEHTGVAKLSVDARHGQPKLVYTVAVTLKQPGEEAALAARCPDAVLHRRADFTLHAGTQPLAHRPVVCGLGPAGLFAALLLARQGYRPIVLERGPALDARVQAVEHFSATGQLDPNANIQFGEGGAGTFSDGKLTTRIGDELCDFVTEVFLQHGAPAEIAWKQKPHVGTDLLRGVITSIRKEIESLGGEVHFNTALTGLERKNGQLVGITTTNGSFACETLVFAVGHSARDTFSMLMDSGLMLECKPFSVGFRAEHLQSEIEKSLYHEAAGHPALPRGEYQLSQHVGDRCVYTFCMCPGGFIVPAASGPEQVVVNGMSPSNRGSRWSNSGMVVEIQPEDFISGELKMESGELAAQQNAQLLAINPLLSNSQLSTLNTQLTPLHFQEELERQCWLQGGRRQTAPAQRMLDFTRKKLSFDLPESSYSPGLISSPLHFWMPDFISKRLSLGFQQFGRTSHGFLTNEAVMIGVETRTSSPVRIVRDKETLQHVTVRGLFPCGEGAGYAGGIVSAGVDGERCAEAVANYINH